jgi:outer membrane protein OmpA-like peptidoglycan-associated protein
MVKKNLDILLLFLLLFFICIPCLFGQSESVKTIYFKSNSSYIDNKYEKSLALIANKLASDSFGFLKIFAYADTNGSSDYNDLLSEKRAEAVYNYLRSRRINKHSAIKSTC